MAMPPERIRIKRRRDDEPVETLYVGQKRQRSHFIWRRVSDGDCSNKLDSILPPLSQLSGEGTVAQRAKISTGVPSLQITRSSNDTNYNSNPNSCQFHPRPDSCDPLDIEKFSKLQPGVSNSKKPPNPLKIASKPRTFQLSSDSYNMATMNGIQKPKKCHRGLACFVETKKASFNVQGRQTLPWETDSILEYARSDSQRSKSNLELSPRKRPVTSGKDRKRTNQNCYKTLSTEPVSPISQLPAKNQTFTDQWDHQSTVLAETLHEIALQETASFIERELKHPQKRVPKIRPGSSKAGLQDNLSRLDSPQHDEILERTEIRESEDSFVYDTYIRTYDQNAATNSITLNVGALDAVDSHRVGILIITEQDQSEWEAFGEDEESDKDWNSEEEDENAEDFYGNDYPEEELDSDDEYGRGAYNLRKYASDDEEYDEETMAWSDDCCEGQYF